MSDIGFVSSVTGQIVEELEMLDGVYWRCQAQEQIPFARCVQTLANRGLTTVVEIGVPSSMGNLIARSWPQPIVVTQPAAMPTVIPSPQLLTGHGQETERVSGLMSRVPKAYEVGLPLAFAGLFTGEERRLASVPYYPFQRKRC